MKKTPTVDDIAKFFDVEPKSIILSQKFYWDRVAKQYVTELEVRIMVRTSDLQNWNDTSGRDEASQSAGQTGVHGSPDANPKGGVKSDHR